ncbi:hypothetical protein [Dactylosporangium sp. NPDC000521]|uniref:hypothetical protein n=1 Tax=Dactylosporangium sp. NPDC000521 TaxID=3363975 RepID=UPI0036B41CAE
MPVTAVAVGALAVVFAMAVAGKVSSRSFTRFRRSAAALRPGPGRPRTTAAVLLEGRPGTAAPPLIRAVAGGAAGLTPASLEDIVSLLSIPPAPAKGAGR